MTFSNSTVASRPERVVLLGAGGFIGQALARRLAAQGVSTLALSSAQLDLSAPQALLTLAELLRPSDTVVMLAALTPDKGRDVGTLMKNLAMMQNLCGALEKSGCAHLVYFSSDAVYGTQASRVTEDTALDPQDLYGTMHCTREAMARSLADIPLLVLRPTLVYGLHDSHNAYGPNRFLRSAHRTGGIALFGDGEETRDHIHVDDVAALCVRCVMQRCCGILNLATGLSATFRAVAELVAAQFEQPVQIAAGPRVHRITHRHYDVMRLIQAFPDVRMASLNEGLARVHRQMSEEAHV